MHNELTCGECNTSFSSAATLLKHFAQHANQFNSDFSDKSSSSSKRTTIPDLYPISLLKISSKQNKSTSGVDDVDSGVEDVNPLRYCSVSIKSPLHNDESTASVKLRKYKCSFCLKSFGWSTDLKRHTLIHTGERPFRCTKCDCTFTRKFLLQKHNVKQHNNVNYDIVHSGMLDSKMKLPALKPISFLLKRKSRKQDKQKIKRKILYTKNLYQSIVSDELEVAVEEDLISSK